MTRGSWLTAIALTVVAGVMAWFLGLDANHAVVVVAAAFTGGIANGLLEALTTYRFSRPAESGRDNGLADIQALDFSISASRLQVGARATLQLSRLVESVVRERGLHDDGAGHDGHGRGTDEGLGSALAGILAPADDRNLTRQQFEAALMELQTLMTRPGTVHPSRTSFPPTSKDTP